MNFDKFHKIRMRFGLWNAIFDLFYYKFQSLWGLYILRGMVLSSSFRSQHFVSENPENPAELQAEIIDENTLGDFTLQYPEIMSPEFLIGAMKRGDICWGFKDHGKLVSFGWYTSMPADFNKDLDLYFHHRYIYMYKGFTLPEYRGKNLHSLGMNAALNYFEAKGHDGLISYVEANNFPSLRSCAGLGYRIFGSIWHFYLGRRPLSFSTPGCSSYSFYLRPKNVKLQKDCSSPV